MVHRELVVLGVVFAAGAGTEGDGRRFAPPIENFYMTDPTSRASETMAECTQVFVLDRQEKGTGTNG